MGPQEPQMYCLLSMKLNDIDLLGSFGLNIDLGQCIMILTITKRSYVGCVLGGFRALKRALGMGEIDLLGL